jgi:hypothetical protein
MAHSPKTTALQRSAGAKGNGPVKRCGWIMLWSLNLMTIEFITPCKRKCPPQEKPIFAYFLAACKK